MARYHQNNDIQQVFELTNVDLVNDDNFFVEVIHDSGEVVKRLAAKAADGFFINDTTVIDATHLQVDIHREETAGYKLGAYVYKLYQLISGSGFTDSVIYLSDTVEGFQIVSDTETTDNVSPETIYNGVAAVAGEDGEDGADGLSAYEIAVIAGYSGTESEWLLSLVGADGADGQDGATGADGSSAYEIAVAAGYSGTESEWLLSLVGADGAPGADGADGAAGADGADAPELQVQYSEDASSWHSTPTASDRYMHFSADGGTAWGGAITYGGNSAMFTSDPTTVVKATGTSWATILATLAALETYNWGGRRYLIQLADGEHDTGAAVLSALAYYNGRLRIEPATACAQGSAQNASMMVNDAGYFNFLNCNLNIDFAHIKFVFEAAGALSLFNIDGKNLITTYRCCWDVSAAADTVTPWLMAGSKLVSHQDHFIGSASQISNFVKFARGGSVAQGGEVVILEATYATNTFTNAVSGPGTLAIDTASASAFTNKLATGTGAVEITKDDNDGGTGTSKTDITASSLTSITDDGATLNVTSNRVGTVYYGIYADGSAVPTVANIIAGTGTGYVDGGNMTASTANVSVNDAITGLSAETTYDIYMVALDSLANESDKEYIELTTIAASDTTAPTLTSVTIENAAPTNVVMVFDEVVTGTNLGFTLSGTTETTFASISGSGTNTITGVLATAAANGETILLSYNSGTGDIEDDDNNALASFTNTAVTNNIIGEQPIMSFQTDFNGTWDPYIYLDSGTLRWNVDGTDYNTNEPSVALTGSTVDVYIYAGTAVQDVECTGASFTDKGVIGELDFSYFTMNGFLYAADNAISDVSFNSGVSNTLGLVSFNGNTVALALDFSDCTIAGSVLTAESANLTSIVPPSAWGTALSSIALWDNDLSQASNNALMVSLDTYFGSNTPLINLSVDFSGGTSEDITDGASNTNLVSLQATYTGEGLTATVTRP